MNFTSKIITLSSAVIIALLMSGFFWEKKDKLEFVTEESLGLRKTDLYTETNTMGAKTDYPKEQPGTSTRFPRAYYNAPPMIPHDTTGFIPITKGLNSCIGCHTPSVAPAMGATPIPNSHFTNYRPRHLFDGKMFKSVTDHLKSEIVEEKIPNLSNARYNCTQCHAPQSKNNLVVKNNF